MVYTVESGKNNASFQLVNLVACILAAYIFAGAVAAQGATKPDTTKPDTATPPPARTHYKGRQIAQTMHYRGAPWLVRESREREEECSRLLQQLRVKPGDVVCDLGCGNGFYALKIAELVGAAGKVLAVDIQEPMLKLLRLRARDTEVGDRVETILGTLWDPKLPKNGVDLVLLVDVYHELSHPELVLQAIRASLRPGGRVALAEFRTEDPEVPIKRLHKMSKRQILREFVPNGFRLVRQFDALPWQHLMFFERTPYDDKINDDALAGEVRAGLAKATEFVGSIATHGGYAGIYSLDLKERFGEALYEKVKPTEIWVQPPGTPSVGQVFLRAFRLTGDDRYFLAARDAGRALAWGQRQAGGWDHRVDVAHLTPEKGNGAKKPERKKGHCTFDDNISQGALTFLIELDDLVAEPWLIGSIQLGLSHLMQSQAANGGWPQWYPLRGGYHDDFTFNDGAINDCIRVALLANETFGRKDCLAAALRGGEFIIRSQLADPQAGWAQQYSRDLKPTKARAFEPAAVCSAVTARNIRTLQTLRRIADRVEFAAAIARAEQWLARSKMADGRWARFYEIGSNRPIYGDRDGKVYYSVDEISEERRKGYAWHGNWGDPHRLRATSAASATSMLGVLSVPSQSRAQLAQRVRAILAAMDENGRFVRDGRIHIADFVRNAGVLCDYLAARPK